MKKFKGFFDKRLKKDKRNTHKAEQLNDRALDNAEQDKIEDSGMSSKAKSVQKYEGKRYSAEEHNAKKQAHKEVKKHNEYRKNVPNIQEKISNLKTAIAQNKVKVISGATAILAIVVIAIIAINQASKMQNNQTAIGPELAKAMTYPVIEDKEEEASVEGTENVKFDAFFLRDINGDGYAESIRGTSKEIGKEDTLYMELNVQTAGYLKDAKITVNGENFYLQTSLPKDDELKDNYIGNNIKTIEFNNLANGTQKMLTGIVRSGDYSYSSRKADAIGNNINTIAK